MKFANPWFLLLLPIALGIFIVSKKIGNKTVSTIKFPLPKNFSSPKTLSATVSKSLIYIFRFPAIILLIIAIARPQEVNKTVLPPSAGVDIILCLDTSTSMRALDFEPYNRFQAAKKTATEFIQKRRTDRIGIVVFAGSSLLQCPLTLDHESLLEFLDATEIDMLQVDGTAIGDALATATNHLKDSTAKSKIIVLLTDGRSNSGIITDPVLSAKAAKSFGIKIYTIGTAGKGPAKTPVYDPMFGMRYAMQKEDLDEGTLLEIARTSGGEFFRAKNYEELQNIYEKIDSLEKTTFQDAITISYNDLYLRFVLIALLLLLLEFTLNKTLFVRLP
jgi:Ca-activated chloride channel homolog